MDEQDYWLRLEHRVCAEFTGFSDRTLRAIWCDGLEPSHDDLSISPLCIHGRAWSGPSGQEHWRFTLVLAPGIQSREVIDWAALLPADNVTGWLTPDPSARTLLIEPPAAYPD